MPHEISTAVARSIEVWEDDGGARRGADGLAARTLSGSASQVEWAERIRSRVDAEFDRVAASFRAIAGKQSSGRQADTAAVIAILEAKRDEVMNREQAGYFIHDWQDISDQVRRMIFQDAAYPDIRARIAARRD